MKTDLRAVQMEISEATEDDHGELPPPAVDTRPTGRGCLRRFLAWDGCLMTCSSVGVVVGFAVGFALHFTGVSATALVWIGLPGELFLRMLKAGILPLVVSSIITGTAGLQPKENGRVSAVSLLYIILTNTLGSTIGTLSPVIFQPGSSSDAVDHSLATVDTGNLETSDLFADLIRNIFPDNVVTTTFQKDQTRYRLVVDNAADNGTAVYERYLSGASGPNYLGLVTVCVVVGMAAAKAGPNTKPFLDFFHATADISVRLIHWIVLFTPVGAASLIARAIAGVSDMEATFRGLGLYVLSYSLGLVVMLGLCLPLIHLAVFRTNPLPFFLGALRAALTGAAVPSSLVAMPETIICLETQHKVDPRVSRFVAAMTVNLNRDGSCVFIACTTMYMAQIHGNVTFDTVLLNIILASVGSLAIPVVPSASMVTVLMMAASLGFPPANIGILLALEWFSDRIRTFTNVFSHVLCGVITWRFCEAHVHGSQDTPLMTTSEDSSDSSLVTSAALAKGNIPSTGTLNSSPDMSVLKEILAD